MIMMREETEKSKVFQCKCADTQSDLSLLSAYRYTTRIINLCANKRNTSVLHSHRLISALVFEPLHEKTGFSHIRKQRHRSVVQ